MKSPPLLLRPSSRFRSGPPLAFFVLCFLSLSAYCLIRLNLSLPPCSMRVLFGLPCLLCGGTRSLSSLFSLDFYSSLLFNPLVFSLSISITLWFLLWLWNFFSPSYLLAKYFARPSSFPLNRSLFLTLLCAVLIHWLYLCLTLPL